MILTFDGNEKNIIVQFESGETTLTVDVQWLYSRWKEWVLTGDNSKWVAAFSNIGGEPIGGGEYVGATFFLINGWRIAPITLYHSSKLILAGNIFPEFAGDPIMDYTLMDPCFSIAVERRTSTLPSAIETSGALTDLNIAQISQAVWSHIIDAGYSAEALYRLIAAVQLGKSVVIGDQVQFLQVSTGTVSRVTSDIDPTDQERLTVTLNATP